MLTLPSDPRSAKAIGAIAMLAIAPSKRVLIFITHSLKGHLRVSIISAMPAGLALPHMGKVLPENENSANVSGYSPSPHGGYEGYRNRTSKKCKPCRREIVQWI
jgi:hypothetical protein